MLGCGFEIRKGAYGDSRLDEGGDSVVFRRSAKSL